MGTIIKSSYASPDGPQSSIGMAVFAVQNCLKKVGMHVQDVDVLINIGVFRDKNIVEPAMAPLIQQQLGMNLDPVQNDHIHRTTFSFDINDGECGFLTAVSVADGFLKSGAAKHALIVSETFIPRKAIIPLFRSGVWQPQFSSLIHKIRNKVFRPFISRPPATAISVFPQMWI